MSDWAAVQEISGGPLGPLLPFIPLPRVGVLWG